MTYYAFAVREVDRNGFIAWDAIEDESGHVIHLHKDGYVTAGSYPEISEHLRAVHGADVDLSYSESFHDKLEGSTWTFLRGEHEIVIRDIPRTIARISGLTP